MTRVKIIDIAAAGIFFVLGGFLVWLSFGDAWAWFSCVVAPKVSCEPLWAQTLSGRMSGAGLAILMFGLGLRVIWNMRGGKD